MNLLFDTQALLWFCEGSEKLSATARAAMEDAANQRYVSHASAWEVAIKISLGKLKLQVPYEVLFPAFLRPMGSLSPEFAHYRALLDLPFHHRDPFDRLLIAQAQTEGLTLVSCDRHAARYGVPMLW